MSTITEKTRMASLISGLDYEGLVKAGTTNIKSSLDKKKQNLQTLKWKQDAYRDVYQKLKDFQSKNLDILSTTSIRANSVMKKNKAISSNDKLAVTASSNALEAEYKISSIQQASKAQIAGDTANSNSIDIDFSDFKDNAPNYVVVTLDGIEKTISFNNGSSIQETKSNFLDSVNSAFRGHTAAAFSFASDSNELIIVNGSNDNVSHIFSVGYTDVNNVSKKQSNRVSINDKLGSVSFVNKLEGDSFKFSINDKTFEFSKDSKISDIINEVNKSNASATLTFDSLNQKFKLESKESGAGKSLKISQETGNLLNALFNTNTLPDKEIYGTNARMTINGVTLENSSNVFNIDGVSFNVSNIGNFTSSTDKEDIVVNVSKDNSGVKDVVLDFVKEYNNLFDDLHKILNTNRPKDSKGNYYNPLTDEEEEELDSKEIEKWNDKAKTGLLYRDPTVFKIFTDIRSAINTSVNGMSIHALGIDTSKDLNKYGKLEIKDEAKLAEMIEAHPDAVAEFFTDTNKGLGTVLNDVVKAATDTTSQGGSYKGSLVKLAGVENTSSATKNMIYAQIESMQKMINQLNEKYEKQTERLWDKYSKLETFIARMNEQSSIFGSGQF